MIESRVSHDTYLLVVQCSIYTTLTYTTLLLLNLCKKYPVPCPSEHIDNVMNIICWLLVFRENNSRSDYASLPDVGCLHESCLGPMSWKKTDVKHYLPSRCCVYPTHSLNGSETAMVVGSVFCSIVVNRM